VTSVLVVGVGAVGGRCARQLIESEGVEHILLCDRDGERAASVAQAMGPAAEVVEWSPAQALPRDLAAVTCALPGGLDRAVAERALEAGVPCASSADDPTSVSALLDLDDAAREAGLALAAGCALAPGLADVLVRHAAGGLDDVIEVHVARVGGAGAACAASLAASVSGDAREWRDRAWVHERAGSGHRLVWFPPPVGSFDCARANTGQLALLVDAFPDLERASARVAARRWQRAAWRATRSRGEGGYGAVWVEVRGRRGDAREVTVLGVVDRMAVAAGTVLAVATVTLAGLAGGAGRVTTTGAHGLGALVEPVPFLAELARRGVRVAVFDGSAAA
jgi:hypothetical protein